MTDISQRDADFMLFAERDMPRAVVLNPHCHFYAPDVRASGNGPAIYRCTRRNVLRDGVCDAPTEFRAFPLWLTAPVAREEQDLWL